MDHYKSVFILGTSSSCVWQSGVLNSQKYFTRNHLQLQHFTVLQHDRYKSQSYANKFDYVFF